MIWNSPPERLEGANRSSDEEGAGNENNVQIRDKSARELSCLPHDPLCRIWTCAADLCVGHSEEQSEALSNVCKKPPLDRMSPGQVSLDILVPGLVAATLCGVQRPHQVYARLLLRITASRSIRLDVVDLGFGAHSWTWV